MTEEGNAPIQDPMEFGEMANWTPLDGSEGLKRKRTENFEADFDYYYSSYNKARGMEILDRLRTMNPETKAEALDWLIDNGFLHSEEVFNSAYINAMGDAIYITSDDDEDDYDAEMVTGDEVFTEAERNKDYQPYRSPGMMSYSQMTPSDMKRLGFAHTFIQPQNTHKMMRELNLSGNVNPPLRKLDMLNGWMDKAIDDAYQDATGKTIYEAQGSPSATIPVNEPSWVKPMATALGFALGFFGIHEIKKVL